MAKRRRLLPPKRQRPGPRPGPKPGRDAAPKAAPKKQQRQRQQHEQPLIPFSPEDRILLVGEGDLSFAASIIKHHGCINVTATVLDKDHAALVAKHPAVDANIAVILGSDSCGGSEEKGGEEKGGEEKGGEDKGSEDKGSEDKGSEDKGGDDSHSGDDDSHSQDEGDDDQESHDSDNDTPAPPNPPRSPPNNRLLYNVDATKLPPALARPPRFDRILFNFPHVGGKSTDVNRQVRHNQSLLVAFFERALPALAPRGALVVTLFDGEPYSLWNVRDLARHAGLAVERSFAFRPSAYPGYRHARTAGTIRTKSGGWRGEDRPARSYVFRRKGEVDAQPLGGKKRRRDGDSSDDDD